MRRTLAWALVLSSAVGCGGSDSTGTRIDPGEGPPCGGLVTLRLHGVDAGALTGFALETGAITADAGGALPVEQAATGPFELVSDDAFKLGVIAPPAGAGTVSVSLPLVAATVSGGTAPGALSTCTPPIEFAFDPAKVDPLRCHVVVELSAARSVVAGASPFVLPQFKIRY